MASLLRSRAGELENGTGLDGPGLVDCASHLAAEEAAHVAGDVDEPAQLDVGAQAASLQGVHQVLGAGVAPRHLRERAAAEAGHRRLEVPDAGAVGGVAVGEREPVGVVEVTGPRGALVEGAEPGIELLDLVRVHEGAQLEDVDPGVEERFGPRDLLLRGDDALLHLQPVAEADLVDEDVRRAHLWPTPTGFVSPTAAAIALPISRVEPVPPMS